jgi:hypothetical protein
MDEEPSLGQMIWLVRRELEWARAVDAGNPLKFDVGSVELDVDVEVAGTGKGEGGLDLKVLGIGGKASGSLESTKSATSRVHVVLTPRDSRTWDGRLAVAGADSEPPPRRAEAPTPGDQVGSTEQLHSVVAADTELQPGPG